jgi:nicotinamidase/pyrazinamidase
VRRVLWDVDTQVDFVRAEGKLAVPDAESALPAMARLVAAARAAGVPHVASADDHELTDDEISAEPD